MARTLTTLRRLSRAATACVIVALACLVLSAAAQAQAQALTSAQGERRVALVVGIGAYQNAPTLPNPVRDARAMADALRRLNFDVQDVYDPDFRTLTRALRDFGIKAQQADAAVLYYAGHGVQVGRENYIIPADARLERDRDLLYEAVPLELVLGEASQAKKLSIVLLDACRNNPFVERITRSLLSASRGATSLGLARVDDVPRNTMVVMSTRVDQVAEDGAGEHSPFAEALLRHLATPGLELSLFFRNVRDTVLAMTNGRQEPYVFSSLGAEPFYFNPLPPNRPPVLGATGPLEVHDDAGVVPLRIGMPTDPDGDRLTVRVTGLPRHGDIQIGGRAIRPGDVVDVQRLAAVTYKPEPGRFGAAGSFDFLVEDGRGGAALGTIPIGVTPSNRPPVVEAPRRMRIYVGSMGIARPIDPDGDPLVVTIRALPRGQVRNGTAVLRVGDRLRSDDLGELSFVPEPGFVGYAGTFRYLVEDGRGGQADGSVDLDVMDAVEGAAQLAETTLWERVRANGQLDDLDTFLRLYPNSQYAPSAQQIRGELMHRTSPGQAQVQAAVPAPSPPPAVPGTVPATSAATTPASPPPASAQDTRPASKPPGQLALLVPAVPGPPPPSPETPRAVPAVTQAPPLRNVPDDRVFQDCPTCPVMVQVPGGSFMMGQGGKDSAALPVHRVTLRAFALGKYPVTIGEWKACMADGGCGPLPRMGEAEGGEINDRTPLHNVSWDDAAKYIAWLSQKTGQPYRLPSESEWEYAARAGTATRYWWGDQVVAGRANCGDCGGTQYRSAPMPVDSLPPNPFGLVDMLGGVAQWTRDCWFASYTGAPADGAPREGRSCLQRVLRGGSFRAPHDEIQSVSRNFYDAPVRYPTNGFRVARSLN